MENKKSIWQQTGRDVADMEYCDGCDNTKEYCQCDKEEAKVESAPKKSMFDNLKKRLVGDKNLGEAITENLKKMKK